MSNDFEAALTSLYNEAMSALPNLDKVAFTHYKPPKAAAHAAYKALCKDCELFELDPGDEVFIREEDSGVWKVSWESGPYEWSIGRFINGPWGLAEPYFSFDLDFCKG